MRCTPPRLKGFDYGAARTYFVTFCVQNRQPLFRTEKAAKNARLAILDLRAKEWYWLNAYCVMPDHLHLIIKKRPERSLQVVVATLKRSILFRCRQHGIRVVWQSGFHDRIVRDYERSQSFVTYVLMNPVRAGLVDDFRDYKYSGWVDPWF